MGEFREPTKLERDQANLVAVEFVELMNRFDKEGFASGVILAGTGIAIADMMASVHSPQEIAPWFRKQAEIVESALS